MQQRINVLARTNIKIWVLYNQEGRSRSNIFGAVYRNQLRQKCNMYKSVRLAILMNNHLVSELPIGDPMHCTWPNCYS